MTEETFETRLESALKEHALDAAGNIYTIGLNDVMVYVDEMQKENPELFRKAQNCDPTQLAIEIADMIGSAGIVEHIESAIREAIRTQYECLRITNQTINTEA
ncbi:MAG: hypothetical protein WBW94_04500 [Anaerolineales bacterium]